MTDQNLGDPSHAITFYDKIEACYDKVYAWSEDEAYKQYLRATRDPNKIQVKKFRLYINYIIEEAAD